MAASVRSPSMRDQRRADDSYRDRRYRQGEFDSERRSGFADRSKSQRSADLGVKLRGRGTVNRASQSPAEADYPGERGRLHRKVYKKSGHSPQREYNRERPPKQSDQRGDESPGPRHRYRGESRISSVRRRSPSNSPYRGVSSDKFARKRSVSPGRSVRHVRRDRSASRNRARDYSTSRGSKAEHHSYHHHDKSYPTSTLARDAYFSSAKRPHVRSPAPDRKHKSASTHRELLSGREISQSDTKPHGKFHHRSTRDWTREERETPASKYRRKSPSQDRSPSRYQDTRRRRREHRSLSPAESGRKRKHYRSPVESDRPPSRRSKMQSSTRPIQSILDEGSRQPSPPRPIPTFDSDSHDSGVGGGRENFSMHGMKGNEVHGSMRSGRSQHIDTRQPYSASPQWTPTSSHHGSPQSGSPFSHGRGAWSGPSQHFHGQQR